MKIQSGSFEAKYLQFFERNKGKGAYISNIETDRYGHKLFEVVCHETDVKDDLLTTFKGHNVVSSSINTNHFLIY